MKYENKYVIHILPVSAVDGETFDLPKEQNAIIVCTSHNNKYVYQCYRENVLNVDFPDVQNANYTAAFNRTHARQIINFVKNLPKEVTDIYVCCEQGASRSPAVAAFLLSISGRNDDAVWCNPYYSPNALVYKTLCLEYGLQMSEDSVKMKVLKNEQAFRMAKQSGECEYERWELLF